MAEKISFQTLHELLEEIQNSEGLPENLSTEAQLWDEALKKEVYHFECHLSHDGTMVLRMFEYDVHVALNYPTSTPSSDSGASQISLTFPRSAVLYLQDTQNTPDYLQCQIHFQDGGAYTYKVPVLKIQAYSLAEIEKKHLNVLIPFLPLRFRKKSTKNADTGKISFHLSKEELTSFYQELILILDREVKSGQLTEHNCSTILSLLRKSMIRVFYQDEILIKEVVKMTEPILELEIEKYIYASDEAEKRFQQAYRKREQTNQKLADTNLELEQANQELSRYKQESAQKDLLIQSLQEQLAALQSQPAAQ